MQFEFFFFQAEDGIRDIGVTGVQTCALPIFVAGYIELPVPEKQGLLETLSVEERLRRVLVHVQRQIGLLEAQEDIKSAVQEELGERQREMYLREQLKAIQKELGDDDSSREITELRDKLTKLEIGRAH